MQLRAFRRGLLEQALPDVAEQAVEKSPEQWTAELDKFVRSGDCEMTGVARLQPEWVFDHEFFLLLNLAVGGQFAGTISLDTEFPANLYVDYVRVYQRTP